MSLQIELKKSSSRNARSFFVFALIKLAPEYIRYKEHTLAKVEVTPLGLELGTSCVAPN